MEIRGEYTKLDIYEIRVLLCELSESLNLTWTFAAIYCINSIVFVLRLCLMNRMSLG